MGKGVKKQLTEVKTTAGATIATYKYEENGRRNSSNVDSKEMHHRYDGASNHILFAGNSSGKITKAYTYDNSGEIVAEYT